MTMTIGDTGEFPIITPRTDIPSRNATLSRTPWSGFRAVSFGLALLSTVMYVLAVAGRPDNPVLQLPQEVMPLLRVIWMFCVQIFLANWAYERIAPQFRQRHAALRQHQREFEARCLAAIIDVERQAAVRFEQLEESIIERIGGRRGDFIARVAGVERAVGELTESLSNLTEAISAYGADKREEGYEACMVDHELVVPSQPTGKPALRGL